MNLLLSFALLSLAPSSIPSMAHAADDWPQFRGPNLDAISQESDWQSEGKPDSLWEKQLGRGYSVCSVVDGRLFTMGFDEAAGEDVVWCLEAETGKELWSHRFPAKLMNQLHGGGTLTTPTLHAGVAYVLNREGNLFALDAADGKVRWHRQLVEDFELTFPTWGFSASPLVQGEDLLINVGRLLCLDPATGKERWQSKDYGHAYSCPVPFEHEGQAQLALFNSKGLAILTPKDGSEHAFHGWESKYDINAATPTLVDGKLFISSGIGRGCALLDLQGDKLVPVWENKHMSVKMSSAVLLDGVLYGFDDRVLKAMDTRGEVAWTERGLGNGAVLGTPDRVIMVSGEGALVVFAAEPKGYTELSRVQLFEADKEVYWTRPTLAGGLIYARSSLGHLICRDHRKTQ